MGHYVARIKDKYMVFSTISDEGVTYIATLRELYEHYRDKGDGGLDTLRWFRRCLDENRSVPLSNQAGPGGANLTIGQIWERFASPQAMRIFDAAWWKKYPTKHKEYLARMQRYRRDEKAMEKRIAEEWEKFLAEHGEPKEKADGTPRPEKEQAQKQQARKE